MKSQVASKFIKDDESAQQVSFEFQTIAFRFIFRTFKAQYDIGSTLKENCSNLRPNSPALPLHF